MCTSCLDSFPTDDLPKHIKACNGKTVTCIWANPYYKFTLSRVNGVFCCKRCERTFESTFKVKVTSFLFTSLLFLIILQEHAKGCPSPGPPMSNVPQAQFTAAFSLPPRTPTPVATNPLQSLSSAQNVIFHPAISPAPIRALQQDMDLDWDYSAPSGTLSAFLMEDYVVFTLFNNL